MNVDALGNAIVSAFNANELDASTFTLLAAIPDASAFDDATRNLLPELTNGPNVQLFEVVDNVGSIINTRITNAVGRSASLRSGTRYAMNQSVSSDAPTAQQRYFNVESGVWARGNYRYGEQSNTSDFGVSNGYDSDAYSFAIGYDRVLDSGMLVGLSGSYSSVGIDLDRSLSDEIDLDVFQVTAYGARRYDELFLTGQIGYSFGNVDAERTSFAGPVFSDYDISGFNARVGATYDIALKKGGYFSPLVDLHFGSFSAEDYTEQGGLNLSIDSDRTEFLEAKVGVITGREHQLASGALVDAYVHAGYVYDLLSDPNRLNATFGSQLVRLQGLESDDQRVELGAGVNFHSAENFSFGASVDGELAESYFSVGGTIRLKYNF